MQQYDILLDVWYSSLPSCLTGDDHQGRNHCIVLYCKAEGYESDRNSGILGCPRLIGSYCRSFTTHERVPSGRHETKEVYTYLSHQLQSRQSKDTERRTLQSIDTLIMTKCCYTLHVYYNNSLHPSMDQRSKNSGLHCYSILNLKLVPTTT